jgi:segregation and condensation protein A
VTATPAVTAPEVEVVDPGAAQRNAFVVDLDVFSGPFDVLLGLIAKHQLDITEVALARVTDEFIGFISNHEDSWDLEQSSQFLVVAATLLDLKAARLLPQAEVEDEEDLALLEARDLLFARLLQYRAFKDVSAIFAQRMEAEARRFPRAVGLEPRFASLVPEVLLGLGPVEFAALAGAALAPKLAPVVSIEHLHAARVSVREQAALLVERLRMAHTATFRSLVADADDTATVVARFLALLELFREGAVAFEQVQALADLHVRWTGTNSGAVDVHDEFDEQAAAREAVESDDAGDSDSVGEPEEPGRRAELVDLGNEEGGDDRDD